MALRDDVILRLESFGYEADEADAWPLGFVIRKVENHIMNDCNVDVVPEGLYEVAVDMAVGEFLREKKAQDPGSLTGIDLDTAVKRIKAGDTDITFAFNEGSSTPEQRLDALINYLMTFGTDQFSVYRRIRW